MIENSYKYKYYKKSFSFLIIIFSLIFNSKISAQEVKNITFKQKDKKIEIYYELEGDNNIDSYDVKVFYSLDDGFTWKGPMQHVSGDVGENIKAGIGKTIIWSVLKETTSLTGNLQFKIKAKFHKVVDDNHWRTFYQYMIGIKGGLNIAKQVDYMDDYSKSLVGFNVGVFHRINGDGLISIQQEVLFDRQGSKYDFSEIGYSDENYTTYFDYLSINPIIFQLNIRKESPRIYPELGLSIGILLNRNNIANSFDIVENEVESLDNNNYESLNYQALAGLGIIVFNQKNCISFNLRYFYGIGGIYTDDLSYYDPYQTENIQKHNSCISINVGILF